MKIHTLSCVRQLPCDGAVFVALGNFDGVHHGHAALLRAAVEGARRRGCTPAVFTFRQNKAAALTRLEERTALFAEHGIETLFVADFDAFCRQSPQEFVRSTIRGIGAVGVVCGFNFRFGYRAEGDTDHLRELAEECEMECEVIPPVMLDGVTVSSTEIRRRLSKGELEGVSTLLGRPWSITATVAHGRAVGGKLLSSPTLNLALAPDRALPPYGVYFTEAIIDGNILPSITNLGVRPTFGDSEVLCETHLLDRSGDFYGKTVTVRFLKFRRSERRFASVEALSQAIAEDIASARLFFDTHRP